MAIADKAKTVTTVVQAFLWTIFALFIVGFVFSSTARKHVATMAKEANVKSIGEKGVEFGVLEEKTRQLVQENTQLRQKETPVPVNHDLTPDPTSTAVLTALQQVNPQPTKQEDFWVYVGEYDGQKRSFRSHQNFNVSAPPDPGATGAAGPCLRQPHRFPFSAAKQFSHLHLLVVDPARYRPYRKDRL